MADIDSDRPASPTLNVYRAFETDYTMNAQYSKVSHLGFATTRTRPAASQCLADGFRLVGHEFNQ